jgi:hypothetical protein
MKLHEKEKEQLFSGTVREFLALGEVEQLKS